MLDRIHIYGRTNISVGPIQKQVRFTEEDVRGHLEGYIAGPVRIVTRSRACMDLGFGLCSPEVICDRFYYPYYARVPACLLVRFPVHEASLILALDYGHSPFRRLLIGSDQGIVVWDKGTPNSPRPTGLAERKMDGPGQRERFGGELHDAATGARGSCGSQAVPGFWP